MTADQRARWEAFYRVERDLEQEAYELARFKARAEQSAREAR